MEKLIYLIWKNPRTPLGEFKQNLLESLSSTLSKIDNVQHFKICIADELIEPAKGNEIITLSEHPATATICIWVNSSVYADEINTSIAQYADTFAGYLVSESEPLPSTYGKSGERTEGMNQIVLLQRPDRLTAQEWLSIWFNEHTKVAIETQSNFGYRQNLVVRAVTQSAPAIDAIVEENFPEAAMHSRAAFFDAEGNDALYKERENTMIQSCAKFIDFDKIDCIPMSEYGFSAE